MSLGNVRQIRPVCQFALGDIVQLKGGSTVMTVTDQFEPQETAHHWYVECSWHTDAGEAQTDVYPVDAVCEPVNDAL